MAVSLSTALLLTAAMLVTWEVCGARGVGMVVGPLFPFLSGDDGQQQEDPVRCEEQVLQLMCDTCPAHLPQCSLDLQGCSWTCMPTSSSSSSMGQGPSIFN